VIKSDILEELRRGTPFAEIRTKFRSQSQLYEAVREYLEEVDETVGRKREDLRQVSEKLSVAENELQKVISERNMISERVAEQETRLKSLETEVREKAEKLHQLQSGMKELEARGFSEDLVRRINETEAKSSSDLLSRVKTAEKYMELKKECSGLSKRKAQLEDGIATLEIKEKSVKESVLSQRNILDELGVQTAAFKESVDIAESFRSEGYDAEDMGALRSCLRTVGIKGDKRVSITRLVKGLEKEKTINAVEEKLRKKREEFAKVNQATVDAKMQLEIIKENTLKAIQETLDYSMQAIRTTAQKTNDSVMAREEACKLREAEFLSSMEKQTQRAGERYEAELKQIIDLERRRLQCEDILGPGLALVTPLTSREQLKAVPLYFVIRLLERIQLWFEVNLPKAFAFPSLSINAKERNHTPFNPYRLSVLIELTNEGLKQQLMPKKQQT